MLNSGIINVIKPPGMTSFQVVSRIKRILGCKKAGHTGTLDPAAAGVLPVCIGKATKVIPFLPEEEKEYIAELTLGVKTDTLDGEGEILGKNDKWQDISADEINRVCNKFIGKIRQVPPMYSAVHHQGKRLYELAREGKEVKREPREIFIKNIEIMEINLPIIRLQVTCSKGTYIRTLAADIGDELGAGAFLSFLIRKRSGPFNLAEGYTLEEIEKTQEKVVLPLDFPLDYPALTVRGEAENQARNGVYLTEKELEDVPAGLDSGEIVLIYNQQGEFISINEIIENTSRKFLTRPLRVFAN